MNGQTAENLWHLTIDDLLAAPADAPRLQGPGPFVINLSASTAPIDVPSAGLKGYEHLLLYQLKQTEDGRTRFRLRLGPITSELEADAILSAVREHYPSALATNAAEDDLKVFERKGVRTAEATTAARRANGQDAPEKTPAAAQPKASALEHMLAPEGRAALDAAGEVAAKTPSGARTAPPGVVSTPPVEDSAEFAIDFDAFLPPLDLPEHAKAPAPAPAPVTGAAKRKKREHAKAHKPKPAVAKKTGAVKFVEPAPDTNAVTDQVAVLAIPEPAGELTLDDAVDSMIVPVLSDAPEHELDMSGIMPAPQMPPAAAPVAQIEPPARPVEAAREETREDQDLAGVVARNNAMVDAIEARNDRPAAQTEVAVPEPPDAPALTAPTPVPPATALTPAAVAPASAAEPPAGTQASVSATAATPPATGDVFAAIAAAPTAKEVEAVQATAILQVDAPADIEADVDDFTSTIVGVEGEQEIEALLDEVPTLVPVPGEALAQLSTEPEPPELVEVVEPARALRRREPSIARVDEEAEPVTLTEAVDLQKRTPVPVAAPIAELTLATGEPPPASAQSAQPAIAAVEPVELSLVEDAAPAPGADIVEVMEVVEVSSLATPAREPAPAVPEHIERAVAAATAEPATKSARILSEPLPQVDSTQTIRELTPLELADDQASQYFAIQLSLSDEEVDQDQVPHLDIFDAYRLYSVAGMHQGAFKHALRLGFFSDAGSAEAVAGYLRCYFEAPQVTRVANAERERFSQKRVVPRRDIGATGTHTIVELSTAVRVPERRLADISNNPSHRASDSGSLWSRLVAPLKR